MRIPEDGAGVAVVAEDQVFAAVATHFHTFGDGGRVADAFEDNIGAIATGKVANGGDAGFGRFHLVDVDDEIGAETPGDIETRGRGTEQNDFRGARTFGDRECREADRTGTLDDDDVLPINAGSLHAVDGGNESATGADDRFGRKAGGDFENV